MKSKIHRVVCLRDLQQQICAPASLLLCSPGDTKPHSKFGRAQIPPHRAHTHKPERMTVDNSQVTRRDVIILEEEQQQQAAPAVLVTSSVAGERGVADAACICDNRKKVSSQHIFFLLVVGPRTIR